jgi:hypothetical protein
MTIKLRISDPLQLLPYQTGLLKPPLDKKAAEGNSASNLDTEQKAIELGQPIPIVFGKFVPSDIPGSLEGFGGVFISPGATKAQYIDLVYNPFGSTDDSLQVNLCVVLSQGELGEILTKDVYQRTCRKGSAFVRYNQLAGAYFVAGNFVDYPQLWPCPNYCGTDDGTYEDITTLNWINWFQAGDTTWNRQVHVFVRNGIKVPRLIEGTTDSSNNMLDLAIYLIRKTSRVPELLIDTTAITLAANFTATNKFYWDGVIADSSNLEDWMQRMAGFFLLRVSDKNGKKGFRPRLPINGNYTINTGAISWVYGFTEEHLLPDGFQIEYIPLTERKPICAQMIWRQQPPNDIGFIRTTEVRIDGEAVDGPYEQFDMSQFCTWEDHAVKVGAYEVARRKYVTHSLRIKVKPDSFNTTLVLGDIVRVQLRRETDPGLVTFHDYLYEVEKINKTISGVVELDLMHFPIDSQGRSILALYVAGAEGTGYLYDVGRNDYTCDDPDNEGNDDPLPTNVGENNPDEPDTDVDLPNPGVDNGTGTGLPTDRPVFPGGTPTTGYPPSGSPTGNNADDPFDSAPAPTVGGLPSNRPLLPGDEITITPPCCPSEVRLWAIDCTTGERLSTEPVAVGTAIEGDCEVRFEIFNEYLFDYSSCFESDARCVDPSSPDGYGQPTAAVAIPQIGGASDTQIAATADPAVATQFEVFMPLEVYSQYRYITSITGPLFYLEEGTFVLSGTTYNRRIRLRWTGTNGIVQDVVPSFFGLRQSPGTADNKPWGCSLQVAATGQPWPFIN